VSDYRLTAEACADLNAGVNFYDSEYPGLGQDFALEVRRLCRLIAQSPAGGLEVMPDVRRRRGISDPENELAGILPRSISFAPRCRSCELVAS